MAGGDVKKFYANRSKPPEQRRAEIERSVHQLHLLVYKMRRAPQPIVASIRGGVAGFGMSLMMACDLAIAAEDAFFLAYCHIGLSPDGSSTWSPLPSSARASDGWRCSASASRRGRAAPGIDQPGGPGRRARRGDGKLAKRLASGPGRAYAHTKRLIDASLGNSLETHCRWKASRSPTAWPRGPERRRHRVRRKARTALHRPLSAPLCLAALPRPRRLVAFGHRARTSRRAGSMPTAPSAGWPKPSRAPAGYLKTTLMTSRPGCKSWVVRMLRVHSSLRLLLVRYQARGSPSNTAWRRASPCPSPRPHLVGVLDVERRIEAPFECPTMSPKMNRRPSTISHSVGSLPILMPNGAPLEQSRRIGSYFAGFASNSFLFSALTK
jgi:enoyl-CoA hydratase/carnithine racemase